MKGYRCWCGSNKVYEDCHKQIPDGIGLNLHTPFSYPTSWVIRKILDGIKWFFNDIEHPFWLILSIWLQFSVAFLYLTLFYDLAWDYFLGYLLVIILSPLYTFLGLFYLCVLLNGTFGRTKEKRVICTCALSVLTSLSFFLPFFFLQTDLSQGFGLFLVLTFVISNIIIAFNIKRHITALIYGYAGALFQLLGITNLIYVSYFMRS
ncbi:SEC-C metal-binding domain-containing protein [Motilimonas eburnea]|uniref:SEC-C metal-binding domain-containing protein n=1 Tax=Motilimonas eburnea TaxID=1737488 RepID=UPI003D806180